MPIVDADGLLVSRTNEKVDNCHRSRRTADMDRAFLCPVFARVSQEVQV